MKASVVITSKNRSQELRRALSSAIQQSAEPEIIVVDDGSTDGTADMVRAEFPGVRLHPFAESKGLIVRRNQAARLATGEIIVSMDDDAEFSTPHVVEQTLDAFSDPRIGAVAIPYLEPHKDNRLRQRAPDKTHVWLCDHFIGTAHAVRRELFRQLGGYREHLVHQGEESDFCLRMMDAGYFVRLGTSDPIHHFESPKRDFRRMDYYGARNAVLFAWQNVPWPYFPLHLAGTTFNVLTWTFAPARFWLRLRAVMAGYLWCVRNPGARQPVKRATYRLARAMRRGGR